MILVVNLHDFICSVIIFLSQPFRDVRSLDLNEPRSECFISTLKGLYIRHVNNKTTSDFKLLRKVLSTALFLQVENQRLAIVIGRAFLQLQEKMH